MGSVSIDQSAYLLQLRFEDMNPQAILNRNVTPCIKYPSFLKMLNIACSQNAKYFVRIVD